MAHGCIHLQRLQGRHLGFVAGQAAGAAAQKSEEASEGVGLGRLADRCGRPFLGCAAQHTACTP